MNVLDIIAGILGGGVKKGFMPDSPDDLTAIFEYQAAPPGQSFGRTDIIESVQVRTRSYSPESAYNAAAAAGQRLNGYHDGVISILQSTPVLDIGNDDKNPPRREYTVNFTVRRY